MPTAPRRNLIWVSGAILLLVAVRLVAAALIPLSPDEAYYLDWSRFPAWSYYDHPPMAAWWIAAGTALFGDSAFGVRVVAVLSGIPTSIAVYLTGRVLFNETVAERAALWINATLLIGVGSILATPDPPSVMFWSLAILAFALVVKTGRGVWWLAVGAFAGLGVASKLTDLFLGLGIVLCLAAVRDLRRWLASPWAWAGGVITVVVLLPLLMWNAGHDWVTLAKQFGRVTTGEFQPLKFPEFIVTQFAVLNPVIAIFVGLAAVAWIGRKRSYPLAGLGVLMGTALPLIAYMAVHSFHEQIQGGWLAPIFPTLALAAAAAAEAAPPERWGGLRALAFPLGAGLSLVGLVLAANPRDILPYTIDPGQVIRGWEGVAADADALRQSTGAEWIAVTHYGIGGEIAYHLRDQGIPVVAITERVRYAYAPPPDAALLAKPTLIVSVDQDPAPFAHCFAEVERVGSIERRSGGQTVETFAAYLATAAAPGLFDPGCDKP